MSEKENLICPYLEGKILKQCAIFKGAMILTVGELKDYCTIEESFEKCKFFNKENLDEKKTMNRQPSLLK